MTTKQIFQILEMEGIEIFGVEKHDFEGGKAVYSPTPLEAVEALRESGLDADLYENDNSVVICYELNYA